MVGPNQTPRSGQGEWGSKMGEFADGGQRWQVEDNEESDGYGGRIRQGIRERSTSIYCLRLLAFNGNVNSIGVGGVFTRVPLRSFMNTK